MNHPLEKFRFCPVCGSSEFEENNFKSKKCRACGFTYYMNPSAATVAVIIREELTLPPAPPCRAESSMPSQSKPASQESEARVSTPRPAGRGRGEGLFLLVVRRKKEPARGTLDLPGGFSDMGETSEEGVAREVLEETGLHVTRAEFLFSLPNRYVYSGLEIPTMDMFYRCEVSNADEAHAMDDAEDCFWVPFSELNPDDFGLESIRLGIRKLLSEC